MKVKSESEVAQSCPTLCDPMDCSLPGSSAHWIFQARVLEWGAIAFSDMNFRFEQINKLQVSLCWRKMRVHVKKTPFMDHSLVMVRGLAKLNEAMNHTVQGHQRWMGHSEEF